MIFSRLTYSKWRTKTKAETLTKEWNVKRGQLSFVWCGWRTGDYGEGNGFCQQKIWLGQFVQITHQISKSLTLFGLWGFKIFLYFMLKRAKKHLNIGACYHLAPFYQGSHPGFGMPLEHSSVENNPFSKIKGRQN